MKAAAFAPARRTDPGGSERGGVRTGGPATPWRYLFLPFAGFLRRTFGARPDREHEMVLNRLLIGPLILIYLISAIQFGVEGAAAFLEASRFVFLGYFLASLAFLIDLLLRPGVSVPRRLAAIALDFSMLTFALWKGGEVAGVLVPVYLWIIFGNGFRFGLTYLFIATGAGVASFTTVIAMTAYWQDHPILAAGILMGVVVLPLYAASLIRSLNRARQEAEEASRAKSLFMASVSHELRTPLNAVIGLSDLLRDTPLDREQAEMNATVGASARSLLSLINEILDFSRIEAGRMPSEVAAFDLFALLAEIRAMLAVKAREKGVRLHIHVTPRTPHLLIGEIGHLREILTNLVGNAVKFTEAGSVVVAVDAQTVHDGQARLDFEVSDTGIGIAPEAQARIFDSFTQADETIINRFGGTGLGLAIVKQLVELHGGSISVESRLGTGSIFRFDYTFAVEAASQDEETRVAGRCELVVLAGRANVQTIARAVSRAGLVAEIAADPVHALSRAEARRERGAGVAILIDVSARGEAAAFPAIDRDGRIPLVLLDAEAGPGLADRADRTLFASIINEVSPAVLAACLRCAEGGAGLVEDRAPRRVQATRSLSILVADDNRTNQMVISKVLERAGHCVRLVDDGEQALDSMAESDFDLVLMDLNMPVMNGLEATKLHRFASIGRARVPIVALTADATAEARIRCEEAGMDACLTKPIEPARLVALIDEMVPPAPRDDQNDEDVPPVPASVAEIAEHPRFRPPATAPIDARTLADLEALGGAQFLAELVDEFLAEAGRELVALDAAAASVDVAAFRDRVHALRSGAANIGARGIYELCLEWRRIDAAELDKSGPAKVAALRAEIQRVRDALSAQPGDKPAGATVAAVSIPRR